MRIERLTGGLRNANFKINLEGHDDAIVLRVYEQDPTAYQKEIDLLRWLSGAVPVPELLYAGPDALDGSGPYIVLRYVAGMTFRELRSTGEVTAVQQAARSVGKTLAAIASREFPAPGRIAAGLKISGPFLEGSDPVPRMFDSFISSAWFRARAGESLAARVQKLAWDWAAQLATLDDARSLVHSDFGSRNILVRRVRDEWTVVAVIDWEFAFSGSPLLDVGHFLRYERQATPLREPHFSQAFVQHGGHLPENWRQLARVIDLSALCEMLTRESLPAEIIPELVGLVQATVEDRDASE